MQLNTLYKSFDRYSCAIPDPDKEEVILTGGAMVDGYKPNSTVSVYSEAGWQRNLAPLNQARQYHACGSYVKGVEKVRNDVYKNDKLMHSILSFLWSLGEKEMAYWTARRSTVTIPKYGGMWLENFLLHWLA